MFPKTLITVSIVILLGAWFLLVERQNFWEKFFIVVAVSLFYLGFRIITGSSLAQVTFDIQQFLVR